MSTGLLRTLAIASWIAIAAQSEGMELRGRVLDAAGTPAVGVRVSSAWSFPDPTGAEAQKLPDPWAQSEPAMTDERGEFVTPRAGEGFLFLYALSADARSGAIVPTEAQSGPVELGLAPLVEVRGRFEVKAPAKLPKQTALWIAPGTGKPSFVALCFSGGGAFAVQLPPGTYTLYHSTDAVSLWSMKQLREEPLVIQPGSAPVDLGTFELELPLVLHPQGVVLDAQGQPVQATLAETWTVHDGYMLAFGGFSTGEDGRFHGSVEARDPTSELTWLALDGARERAALATWNPAEAEKPLEIRLEPAVRLFGSYQTDAGNVPAWTIGYLRADLPGRANPPRIAECQSKEGRFEFRLPPGKYLLNCYGTGTQSIDLEIELGPDARERDLGVIELPLSAIARNAGKPAMPWHLTDARGLSKDAELADFRGKWVLLEFWGHW